MEQITAKQIHDDFFGAEERLYVEAIGLSQGGLVTKTSKAERLKKIGFGKAKPIKDNEEREEKRAVSGHMIKVIEYFRTYYPQHKFITEAEVKILCGKYGLLLGEVGNFIGDMPEKNLVDIEKFKLRKEDWKEKTVFEWYSAFGSMMTDEPERSEGLAQYFGSRRAGPTAAYESAIQQFLLQKQMLADYMSVPKRYYTTGVDPFKETEKKKEYEQPAFKICAPKEDFETRGWEVKDGYRLVYDPIVLQPVSKDGVEGYLIVTAWGDEAADELVVSPISQ